MKKFFKVILCTLISVVVLAEFGACAPEQQGTKAAVSVYMPDGAPALAMTALMTDANKDMFDREVNYEVVDASTIATYVTGEYPQADICVLPVNSASKLLGTGDTYKMLGTVTHGNLYLLKKSEGEDITKENLSSLIGKTVGIINFAAVPGLTFKLILSDNNLAYKELGNDGTPEEDKVNLVAVNATQVLPTNSDCDYFVVSEPAATTRVNATQGALSFAGDLQNLYGGESGYPQAVIVAKNSLIENDADLIKTFINFLGLEENNPAKRIKDGAITAEDIVNTITAHLSEGMSPTFTAQNLNAEVIDNCAIRFVKSADCKNEVNNFIEKLIAVNQNSATKVDESFYYIF